MRNVTVGVTERGLRVSDSVVSSNACGFMLLFLLVEVLAVTVWRLAKPQTKNKKMNEDILYSAEQIKIPQDLGTILKDFSKSIIRANPTKANIYKWAAKYDNCNMHAYKY